MPFKHGYEEHEGFAFPAEIDGVRHPEGIVTMSEDTAYAPPPELQARHLWTEENEGGGTTW